MAENNESSGFQPAVLEAVLERITYANEETGYTVAKVAAGRNTSDLITVVGALIGAQPGESLRLKGRWRSHPQYGRQFEVFEFATVLPATVQGIRRYLGSGLIKGIGPKMAERIVDHFDIDTLQAIEETPDRLVEVPGLGPKRTSMISLAWEEQKSIKEVMMFLQGVGVSTSLAVRVYKSYGDSSISVVRNQPYRMANDVWGIGFKTADTIARHVGIAHDSPERIKAGLQFTLSEASDSGHCYLPEPELLDKATEILEVDRDLISTSLDQLVIEEGVVREQWKVGSVENAEGDAKGAENAIYLVPFHRAETSLAGSLLGLLNATRDRLPEFASLDWDAAFSWLHSSMNVDLAPAQVEAAKLALSQRVSVITGGPGCGKSFTVRSIVALAKAKRAKVLLAAPTGRAAKRLSELTGVEAATLHRLLQIRPGGDSAYDRDNPLDADLVVVDEASMLDVLLANRLVKAVAPGTHLLFVGDVDQLPSVGAGEVLRDMLATDVIPRVRLTRIFRQAEQSGVVTNAHRINAGHMPNTSNINDFFMFVEDDAEKVAQLTVDIVANRLPKKFGLDPRRDVQVLTPMHRGHAGAATLNSMLQEALTPTKADIPERRYGGRMYRVGDKVIQIRNNYEKGKAGVFNGTVGTVVAMSLENQELTIRTDEDEEINYEFGELDELAHAYAVTVHRSQGSEYPCVVIPVTTSAWMMLQRNLLYTAVTRAKQMVVLVGSKRAVAKAIRTASTGRRHTSLDRRLAISSMGSSMGHERGDIGSPT